MKILFTIHFFLLILVISNSTLITVWFDDYLSFSIIEISQKDSIGRSYEFEYSFLQVMVNIVCYASGLYFYLKVPKIKLNLFLKITTLICLLGLSSFLFELSHWVINFNLSLIISLPIVLVFSSVFIGIGFCKNNQALN
ncbi:MAG: hypothetical protein COA79_12935 [Planctomycetota bacterium]|nr:MAG: hypothetical protein COA79_12935 [Planctomycetota bacterium]